MSPCGRTSDGTVRGVGIGLAYLGPFPVTLLLPTDIVFIGMVVIGAVAFVLDLLVRTIEQGLPPR